MTWLIILAVALLNSLYRTSPDMVDWPVLTIVKHMEAIPRCGAARAVGLAPAHRREPGYWPHLDADHDGISCEVWHY